MKNILNNLHLSMFWALVGIVLAFGGCGGDQPQKSTIY